MKHSTNQAYCQRGWWAPLLSVALLLTVGFTPSQAQMKVRPGVMDTCYASPEIMNTRVHAEHMLAESPQLQQARTAAEAEVPPVKTAEFIVNYTGFTPEAEAAFQYAVDIWSTILVSDVPIRVDARFRPLPPRVLGSAGTTNLFANFADDIAPDTWYVSALADAIAGEDLNLEVDSVAEYPDIITNFSSVFNWYYGTDLNPADDEFDFVTIVLHELGHGLGFTGFAAVDDSTNVGEIRVDYRGLFIPVVYNNFVEDKGDTAILDFPDPSVKLGEKLTDSLFMTGENTVAALGGKEPPLYTPDEWVQGTSYSHWDEETFPPGDPNSLMTPFAGFAEADHRVGDITKGLFEDMGWTINEEPVTLISLRHTVKAGVNGACLGGTPNTDEVGVLPGGTACLYYTVTNVGDIPLTLHNLRDTESGVILFNVRQELAPGESLTVTRQIKVRERDLPLTNIATWTASQPGVTGQVSATAVAKLFYAPVASIRPTREVSVRLEPDARKTRNLSIANRGGSPLTYRTVIRETDRSLDERVAESRLAVAQLSSMPSVSTEASSVAESPIGDMYGSARPSYQGEALRTVEFATDFENFEVGPLGTQNGWFATDSLAQISEESPFSGSKHLRMLSDSTKADDFTYSVYSPVIRGGDEPFSSFAMKLKLNGAAQYRIFPSSFSDVTGPAIGGAIRIEPDRRLLVFDPTAGYVFTGYVLPEGYVDLKYVNNRIGGTFDLYVDDQLLAQDIISFETDVDLVEVRYYGGSSEASLDIDDFELIDGDAAAPSWVFVEPFADTVEARSRLNADIIFDSEGLEPGVYQAEITVITNDPFNPSATVPVKLTVKGDRRPPVVQPLYLRELLLVNAETDETIAPLNDGDVLDLSVLPAITIEAIPISSRFRGSIDFYINGELEERQRYAPYALAGDVPLGDFAAYDFQPGTYDITVVATADGQELSDTLSVSIRVVDGDQNSTLARTGQGLDGAIINPDGLSYQAYPNPVARTFSVQSPDASDPIAHYTLIDNLGRILVAKAVDNQNALRVDMTPHLSQIRSAGIFYLRLMTVEGRSQTMRLQLE